VPSRAESDPAALPHEADAANLRAERRESMLATRDREWARSIDPILARVLREAVP
jgi:hypothetical protein